MTRTTFSILLCSMALASMALTGCSGNSQSDEYQLTYYPIAGDNTSQVLSDAQPPQPDSYQVVCCPTCGGSGMATYFDGSIIPCYNCGGKGCFTVADLQAMIGDGDVAQGIDDASYDASEYMGNQLESELARHERELQSLIEASQTIDGEVYQAYLQQLITQEQCEVKRLREALNY
ncbi:MAG: hypothetical protein IJ613_03370 [Muribaculaceae bacterium]|nr:hypothetical protein [Muribaculaceae bacterium]